MAFVAGIPDTPEIIAAKKAARARIKAGEGFIYVAEVIGQRRVKIGFSLNPRRRMKMLAYSLQNAVRLIATAPGTLEAEQALHARLSDRQIVRRGAWPRSEIYDLSILSHPALPEALRRAAA